MAPKRRNLGDAASQRVIGHLSRLYPQLGDAQRGQLAVTLLAEVGAPAGCATGRHDPPDAPPGELCGAASGTTVASVDGRAPWSQRDVLAIAYADTVNQAGEAPLVTLRKTLEDLIGDAVTGVHVLPFFPATSDGGFAITDHTQVAPHLGTSEHVAALAQRFDLVVDLVINHVSSSHRWVQQLAAGEEPGRSIVMTVPGGTDVSDVVRPRTTPLLRPISTATGEQQLWCTFGPDQVDIDYREPQALVELATVLRALLDFGARWLRLDAVAYAWKRLGTSCVHLPEVHELVRLVRTLVEAAAPDTLIVTETNVAHELNASYFGFSSATGTASASAGEGEESASTTQSDVAEQSDATPQRDVASEAHLVYNFSLPPLVLHALLEGSAAALHDGLSRLTPAPAGCTFLNFLASHDGIGLRPAEGLLTESQVDALVEAAHCAGGTHSSYAVAGPDGAAKCPYELNVSLFSLLTTDGLGLGVPRYLAAHTIVLALAGIPALYLHSFFGTPNYLPRPDCPSEPSGGAAREHAASPTSLARAINRQRLSVDELRELLNREGGVRRRLLAELVRVIRVRQRHGAFHPDAPQRFVNAGDAVFAVLRGDPVAGGGANGHSSAATSSDAADACAVLCLTNVTDQPATVNLRALDVSPHSSPSRDLLTGARFDADVRLAPYGSVWLTAA